MTVRWITPWIMRQELRAVAELKKSQNAGADYSYSSPANAHSCLYVHTDSEGSLSTGCIFGMWLTEYCAVPMSVLKRYPFVNIATLLKDPVIKEYVNCGPIAIMYATWVQGLQDEGTPWLVAVENGWKFIDTGALSGNSNSGQHSGNDGAGSGGDTEEVAAPR